MTVFKNKNITTIHHIAFGEGESYYISYTDTSGETGAWFELEDHYPELHSWLYLEGLAHDYAGVYVSLGLDGAFFASSNQGYRWRNIPEEAQDYFQTNTRLDLYMRKRIQSLDLGYNGTFAGIGVDKTWFWYLEKEYPHLSGLNLTQELPKATFLILNPFAPDQHFAIFQDGSVHYSFPREWASDVASLFQQYASQTVQASAGSHAQNPLSFFNRYTNKPSPMYSQQQAIHQYTQQYLQSHRNSYLQSYRQQQQAYAQPAQQHPSTINEALHLGNNILDTYNNVTNAGGQSGGGGSNFDVNQAMSLMQSSVDTLNNVAGGAGQGMDFANQLVANGNMVGDIAGQFVGAAVGCSVM